MHRQSEGSLTMRIAYFAHLNGGPGTGVYQKIMGQIGRWRLAGHESQLFLFTRDESFEAPTVPENPVVGRHGGPMSRLMAMNDLMGHIRGFRPDLLYWRQSTFYPPVLRIPGRAALVVEVNSDDSHEYALGSWMRHAYNRLTRGFMLGRARALVFVTPELAEARAFRTYPAHRYAIANGIDLDAYPQLPAPRNDQPRLAFVGSPGMPWHGVDKLVALAAMRPEWRFDIGGYDAPSHATPDNITYHGLMNRAEVLSMLAAADVGVASLALHRDGIQQGTTLKMREYLAVGLPVIYAGSDPDVDGLVPHTLQIANTETGVIDGVHAIDEFVHRVRGLRIPRERVAHIHVESKERERLAVFERVLSQKGSG